MPAPKDPEFRRRAVELARLREKSIAQIAKDLGIAESGLRRWMAQADVDEAKREGLTSDERAGAGPAASGKPHAGDGDRDLEASQRLLRPGERAPKIGFRLVRELAADGFPVAVACRVLDVSTSGYYEWAKRPPSKRDVEDAYLLDVIIEVHAAARATYGVRRVHAELVMGRSHQVGRRRVARLMACHGLAGVHRRRWRHHQRAEATWPDHVQRQFVADAPDRLWVTDITQHRTSEGWVYCAAVLDVFSRRVVGWSIADHLRTELVVDALEMARLRRRPVGTILHSDRGTQYTSWLFGHRLREAGLLGSMGKVACAYDNALMESFWGSMQIELLDRRYWSTRTELATAMFEWIEAFYNPIRRHSGLGYRSPVEFERLHKTANPAA